MTGLSLGLIGQSAHRCITDVIDQPPRHQFIMRSIITSCHIIQLFFMFYFELNRILAVSETGMIQ